MKNLKFGVDRANIEDDTAIYKPENLWEMYGIAGNIVRTSIYFFVNFGVFEWLYLVQYRPDKHQTWECC